MSFAKRLLEFAEERGLRDLPHALNIAVKEERGEPITDEDRRLAELERVQGPSKDCLSARYARMRADISQMRRNPPKRKRIVIDGLGVEPLFRSDYWELRRYHVD